MGVLVGNETRLLVQGITGRQGSFHTKSMVEYGTRVVAGVVPGKGGQEVHGVPVYDSVLEALDEHPEINASVVFVPARFAADAVYESIDAGIPLIVVITEHIPVHQTMKFVRYARYKGTTVVGPNTPGVITPGEAKVGVMPAQYFKPGHVGVVSRSGTLTYEVAWSISTAGLGVSTAIGIGGDPITGLKMREAALLLQEDPSTKAIAVIGEIGGTDEEELAQAVIDGEITKPIVAYVAGVSAPPGKRMGHAGAIIYGGRGTAQSKIEAFKEAGVPVAKTPTQVGKLLKNLL